MAPWPNVFFYNSSCLWEGQWEEEEQASVVGEGGMVVKLSRPSCTCLFIIRASFGSFWVWECRHLSSPSLSRTSQAAKSRLHSRTPLPLRPLPCSCFFFFLFPVFGFRFRFWFCLHIWRAPLVLNLIYCFACTIVCFLCNRPFSSVLLFSLSHLAFSISWLGCCLSA